MSVVIIHFTHHVKTYRCKMFINVKMLKTDLYSAIKSEDSEALDIILTFSSIMVI